MIHYFNHLLMVYKIILESLAVLEIEEYNSFVLSNEYRQFLAQLSEEKSNEVYYIIIEFNKNYTMSYII